MFKTVIYNNSNGEKVNMVNPFKNPTTDKNYTYGTEIIIDRDTKVFHKVNQ
jgi:hypothetical protein